MVVICESLLNFIGALFGRYYHKDSKVYTQLSVICFIVCVTYGHHRGEHHLFCKTCMSYMLIYKFFDFFYDSVNLLFNISYSISPFL